MELSPNTGDPATARIDVLWPRRASGGDYLLRIRAPGGERTLTLHVEPVADAHR